MAEEKIKRLDIEHFRGIPNKMSLSFGLQGKYESALIFGDNGSGKSSIIDVIEYVTQGTIQGNQSIKGGGWLYHSVSLKGMEEARISFELSSNEVYQATLRKNVDEYKIDGERMVIKYFRNAPFILRRQDILSFWGLANQQKLKLFLKYVTTGTSSMLISPNEIAKEIGEERLRIKNDKRALMEEICRYYKLDVKEMSIKNQGDFFKYIKLLNGGKNLKQLSEKHPQYKNLIRLNKLYGEIIKLNKKYKEAVKRVEDETGYSVKSSQKEQLQNIMQQIAPLVTESFKRISRTNDYVKEISIDVASRTEMSLEFVVKLDNGSKTGPEMLFSEANRDLLALLIYFEFLYQSASKGQAKVLILDDVFQSVDSTIRFRVMQYVIERFKDWQIIITTHDRLWKEQLIQLFRNHAKPIQQFEILQWTFEEGPRIVGSINNFDEKLKQSVISGSTADICASAGYLLEYMCEKLSCILSTSIKRKYGDKYTIGDLWPGIYKELKKTPAKEYFSELNDLIYLRNMVGSHYNEWSLSLSRSEANDFAAAVLNAYYRVCCRKCGKWIKSTNDIGEQEFEESCCSL